MHIDHIHNPALGESLHPLFPAAFTRLRESGERAKLSAGRIELDGDRLCAIVLHGHGHRGRH